MLLLQAISSRTLSSALQVSQKCISSKNSQVILDYVLLSKKGDNLMFTTATNESMLTINAPLNIVGGEYAGPVALPIAGIVSYLSTLPDCVVNMRVNDDHSLILDYCQDSGDKVKKGEVSLTYLDGDEFPILSGLRDGEQTHICLPGAVFNKGIEQAKIFSASDEVRLVLNTLCIDIAEDMSECYLVSTDARRMIKITHRDGKDGNHFFRSGKPCKMMFYNSFFKTLAAFAGCEQVDIITDGNTLFVKSGDVEFFCKSVEGKYPNYNGVIPCGNPYYIVFDKKEMLAAIKRVSIFGDEASKLVTVKKSGIFVDVKSCDTAYATSATDQVLVSDSKCPDDFVIGLQSSNFINAVSAISSDTVRMSLSDPSRPCTFTEDTPSPTVLTLCMPMNLN